MSRVKKTSLVITNARKRYAGMQSISSGLDLGDGLTVSAFSLSIEETESLLAKYNEMLSEIDGIHNELLKKEAELKDLSSRIFNTVAGKYGKNSIEYEKIGGTRTSERKHRPRKTRVA